MARNRTARRHRGTLRSLRAGHPSTAADAQIAAAPASRRAAQVSPAITPDRRSASARSASTPNRPTAPEDAPWTWTFVVQPTDDGGASRLIVRNRNATMGAVGDVVWDRVVGPIGFAMERRTMLGIAQRAEVAVGVDTGWVWREPLWFAGLLVTGVMVLVVAATRAPLRRRITYVVVLSAAATLVLFRFPSPWLSVALAAVSGLLAVVTSRIGLNGVVFHCSAFR